MKKREYPKDVNQKINNLYSLITIVIMSAIVVLYVEFILPDSSEQNDKFVQVVLPCQKELEIKNSFKEDKELLLEAFELFSKGDYILDGGAILKENSNFDEVKTLQLVNELFENSIDVVSIKNVQKFLRLKYEIIEDDTLEVNNFKLLVSFRVVKDEIFKVSTRINFNNIQQNQKVINCIMEAFVTNAKE